MSSSANVNNATEEKALSLVFHALSDHTRRELLSRLAEGSAIVTELAKPFDISLPAVGKHLRVLEKAGLVQRNVNGRVHRCSLDAAPLRNASQWLAYYQQFWGEALDALVEYVQNDLDQENNA